jgi:hypothetical protein
MNTLATKEILAQIKEILDESKDYLFANMLSDILDKNDSEILEFIKSNELWGGAGSLADQAISGNRNDQRRKLEKKLIELGKEQIKNGQTNIRTEVWIQVFEEWQKSKI